MALETKNADHWSSIAPDGAIPYPTWGGLPNALNTADGSTVSTTPWIEYPLPGPGGITYLATHKGPVSSSFLRVFFNAFSLPTGPDEVIASAIVSVRHRQPTSFTFTDGRRVQFENAGTEIDEAYSTDTFNLDIIGLTIASLNAGNFSVDLLYRGTGANLPTPYSDSTQVSDVEVDHVTLTVTTMTQPLHTKEFECFRMKRIPELGIR
jgi:hypothetical protein